MQKDFTSKKLFIFYIYIFNFLSTGMGKAHCTEKCSYSEFFWSVISRIRTEHGDSWSKSLYSVQMRENTDWKKSKEDTFYAAVFTWYPSKIDIIFHFNQFCLFCINQVYIILKVRCYLVAAHLLFVYIESSRNSSC